MQIWEIIAQLSRLVIENENVYLSILLNENGLSIQLLLLNDLEDYEGEDNDEDE